MQIHEVHSCGLTVKSDIGIYTADDAILLLSVYGAPQQVKALLARVVMGENVSLLYGEEQQVLHKNWRSSHRIKIFSIGYGKVHGLLWEEDIDQDTVFWLSPEEKDWAIRAAISRRTIPFLPEWLPTIERILIDQEIFTSLQGWGGAEGYSAMWKDELVCDLIVEKIFKTRKRSIKKAA